MDSQRKRSTHDRLSVVCPMNDNHEGPFSARGRAIVFSQHAVHNVLVDVDAEWVRDDGRNPWTAEPRVARRELDDGRDQCFARTLRSPFLAARPCYEQSAVLATHQGGTKRQQCRRAYDNGELS